MPKKRRISLGTARCSECSGLAAVFERSGRYWSHCAGCGAMWWWTNPTITTRVMAGRPVCIHSPELRPIRRGVMRQCRICMCRMMKPEAGVPI